MFVKVHDPKKPGDFLVVSDADASGYTPFDQPAPLPLGPTIEEYVAAGYSAETYPPMGYAEVASPGLDAYRASLTAEREQQEPTPAAADVVAPAEETSQAEPPAAPAPQASAPVVEPGGKRKRR